MVLSAMHGEDAALGEPRHLLLRQRRGHGPQEVPTLAVLCGEGEARMRQEAQRVRPLVRRRPWRGEVPSVPPLRLRGQGLEQLGARLRRAPRALGPEPLLAPEPGPEAAGRRGVVPHLLDGAVRRCALGEAGLRPRDAPPLRGGAGAQGADRRAAPHLQGYTVPAVQGHHAARLHRRARVPAVRHVPEGAAEIVAALGDRGEEARPEAARRGRRGQNRDPRDVEDGLLRVLAVQRAVLRGRGGVRRRRPGAAAGGGRGSGRGRAGGARHGAGVQRLRLQGPAAVPRARRRVPRLEVPVLLRARGALLLLRHHPLLLRLPRPLADRRGAAAEAPGWQAVPGEGPLHLRREAPLVEQERPRRVRPGLHDLRPGHRVRHPRQPRAAGGPQEIQQVLLCDVSGAGP
mmetsp:Transcript_100667/g.217357  ORF Transcript_100667/g.217357 Transcript_100667/m.217357 type:complete len:402 (-) Transcript_100667:121-1326(-)